MDMFEHELDRADKADDSNDEVQLTMEDGTDGQSSVSGVVTSLTLDANGQYQFRTDTGSVTYRVVQVTQGEDGQPQLVAGLTSNPTVLHSSLTNGDVATGGLLQTNEGRLTYIPAVTPGAAETVQTGIDATGNNSSINATTGPFYVMMAPQDVLQAATTGQRTLVPRTGIVTKVEPGSRVTRDDRRRATHNEVERRRRDKINSWIQQLAQLVPECSADERRQTELRNILPGGGIEITRSTVDENQKSKGGILQKACDYIRELRSTNAILADRAKMSDDLTTELETLRQQCDELRQENEVLRDVLHQHGIEAPALSATDETDAL